MSPLKLPKLYYRFHNYLVNSNVSYHMLEAKIYDSVETSKYHASKELCFASLNDLTHFLLISVRPRDKSIREMSLEFMNLKTKRTLI